MIDEQVKKFVPYSGECECQLNYRSEDKDKPWGVATIYHPLLIKNQYKFKYQITFLVLFNKYREDYKITSEAESPISSSITYNLKQSEIDNINIQWSLESRKQSIEMKKSGWNFQRNNTMGISIYESGDLVN